MKSLYQNFRPHFIPNQVEQFRTFLVFNMLPIYVKKKKNKNHHYESIFFLIQLRPLRYLSWWYQYPWSLILPISPLNQTSNVNESYYLHFQFSLVQSLSHVWLCATPWTGAHQASLSITNSRSSLKLMPIESVMPSSHLILCPPLVLPPSIFPSIRVFSNESGGVFYELVLTVFLSNCTCSFCPCFNYN